MGYASRLDSPRARNAPPPHSLRLPRVHHVLSLESAARAVVLQLVVEVLEVLRELLVGQHFLQATPGGLAPLALSTDALVHPVEQPIVIGAVFGRTVQEFLVEVEALVVPLGHLLV